MTQLKKIYINMYIHIKRYLQFSSEQIMKVNFNDENLKSFYEA